MINPSLSEILAAIRNGSIESESLETLKHYLQIIHGIERTKTNEGYLDQCFATLRHLIALKVKDEKSPKIP
jgi:hypothetical protein